MTTDLILPRRSLDVIEAYQAPSGAYVASPNFRVYRYSWLRDGAFIADATSRAGAGSSSDAFYAWCSGVISSRATRIESLIERADRGERIAPDEFLPCRYTLDGEDSNDDWENFQLDGYGSWLWSLDGHARRTDRPLTAAEVHAAELSVRYLACFWQTPCYDWWEEHLEHRHTSTLAALYGGLRAAQGRTELSEAVRAEAGAVADAIRADVLRDAVREGRLVKWLGGDAVDASLVACATPFRMLEPDDPRMEATVAAIERELVTGGGGVHRYAADTYYGGGQWPLLSALLGWHYLVTGRREDALRQLDWTVAQLEPSGDLPEQVRGHLLHPEWEQSWIERWGPVATPLIWSHAMLLTLAVELGVEPR